MSGSNPITPEGYERLGQEIRRLHTVVRPQIVRELSEAEEHGDLRENAEYKAAKESLEQIDKRLKDLSDGLASAEIVSSRPTSESRVAFGAHVKILEVESGKEKQYRLVGKFESDSDLGWISVTSPVGASLLGKEVGDVVKVRTPAGLREVEILEVRYS